MSSIMTENPLISIIIPIYNVEEYLPRCLNSVVTQTYQNIEIILINDGSTDSCKEICGVFSKKDERIVYYEKKNGGLSDARNYALNIFNGEYLTFIDSDDYVSKFYVSNLFNAIKNTGTDISASWFENVYDNKKTKSSPSNNIENSLKTLNAYDCLENIFYQKGIEINVCGKLFRKSIFSKLMFPTGKLYEDISVTVNAISDTSEISVIGNVDYYYFQRESSIQNMKFSIAKMDAIYNMQDVIRFIEIQHPKLLVAARSRYFSILCNILFQINNPKFLNEEYYIWDEIVKYRYLVLKNNKARMKTRIAAVISYLGRHIMKLFYSCYINLVK